MKKIVIPVVLTMMLAACGGSHDHAEHSMDSSAAIELKASDLSTNMDYVCGMKLRDDMIADTTFYDGSLYGFCHPGCKEEFLSNPLAYLPKSE
jgi:YHS domain-containing protein